MQQSIDAARDGLNPKAVASAWDRGLKLTEQQAVLLALSPEPSFPPPLAGEGQGGGATLRGGGLTPRELEIASLVAAGLSNRQIGLRLKISERTADAHVEHIRTKLDVHSRAQIAAWATQNGLPVPVTAS